MGALTFRSVRVRRMPGIVDGGFTLAGLAGGVNIVFGPNASGKTTTARTVESLLWPRPAAPSEAWLEGRFEVDGGSWSVEVDAGRSTWQRNGEVIAGPQVAPPEDRDRYRLSLHELLRADDAGFARSIMLESAGGYDLHAAARILGPRVTLSRPRREIDELRLAKERLKKARAVQEALYQQSLSLAPDEARIARRPMLEARSTVLRLALEYDARREESRQLRERLERFNPVIPRLHGKEAEIAAGFRAALAAAEREASRAEFDVGRLGQEIAALDLTPEALDGVRLAALLNDIEELDSVHREVRVEDRRAAEEKARLDAETRRLGAAVRDEALAEVGAEDVEGLSAAARALYEIRAERSAFEAELRLLGAPLSTGDRGRIDRAAFLLQQWLRVGARGPGGANAERPLALAAGVLLILAGAGFALIHPAALLLAIAGAVILFLVLRTREEADPRLPIEAEFATLQIDGAPARWDIEEVRSAYSRFAERLDELRVEESRNERRQRLAGALADADGREDTVRERVKAIADHLGIDPSHDEFRLAWTIDAISRWQKAHSDLAAAVEARERAWEQESDILARANRRLGEAGLEGATSPQHLRARAQMLRDSTQKHEELSGRLAAARDAAGAAVRRQVEVEAQLAELFSRLEITADDEPRLAEWCEQRSGYLALQGKLTAVGSELERLHQRIVEQADDHEVLLARDRTSLEQEIPDLASALEELDALAVRVIQLNRDIENAKRGHDIEDAHAEVDRATGALRAARDRDISAAIAHALVAHVERTSRDQHLPEVFHRASSIFARITHGRYTLRLDDSGSGAFRAYDTTSERSHALEELSSATRLQLLLAVRVAFIELQERGLRLPILMDETLANSDDDRAAAIMDAVLELAENGRQIFYFTAQPDEVRKWSAAMARRPELEGRVIDLGAARKLERRLPPEALSGVDDTPARYPSPGFLNHSAYAGLLHVPPVDVFAPVGSLHLWYLIEEPETLYRVLQTLRTECWGQLDALAEHGGARLLGEELFSRVRSLSAGAAIALSRLRVGRGLPVDRQAIVASGAVTDRYLDEVAHLAAEVGGSAEKLLAALGSRAISGFRANSIQALSSYFEENGYVDERESVDTDSIRIEVLASLTASLGRNELSVPDIDGLLMRLFAGAGARQLIVPEASFEVPEDQSERDAVIRPALGSRNVSGKVLAAEDVLDEVDSGGHAAHIIAPSVSAGMESGLRPDQLAQQTAGSTAAAAVDTKSASSESADRTGEGSAAVTEPAESVELEHAPSRSVPERKETRLAPKEQSTPDADAPASGITLTEAADSPLPSPQSEGELLIAADELERSDSPPPARPQPRPNPASAPAHPPRKREPVDTSHELKLL